MCHQVVVIAAEHGHIVGYADAGIVTSFGDLPPRAALQQSIATGRGSSLSHSTKLAKCVDQGIDC